MRTDPYPPTTPSIADLSLRVRLTASMGSGAGFRLGAGLLVGASGVLLLLDRLEYRTGPYETLVGGAWL